MDFYVTPSGRKYSSLKPKDIVFVSLKAFLIKKGKPSSEWRFHRIFMLIKKKLQAIVHALIRHVLQLCLLIKNIPAFHYMVAVAGGEDIKCTKYATFGTKNLSKNIIKALKNRSACLIANHARLLLEKI